MFELSLTRLDSIYTIEQVACGSCTVAKYNRQANCECELEGKSLEDTAANCASIDFLLHVIWIVFYTEGCRVSSAESCVYL